MNDADREGCDGGFVPVQRVGDDIAVPDDGVDRWDGFAVKGYVAILDGVTLGRGKEIRRMFFIDWMFD